MTGPAPTYLGVDLGGTGTRIVLTDGGGNVLADRSVPTATNPDRAIPDLAAELDQVADSFTAGIGVGVSGPVDPDGIIRNPATLLAYTGLDLRTELASRFRVQVAIENDAVTAAYGEARVGAGQGAHALLMVTLGTGVGVAMLTDGTPLRTATGAHPEAGHRSVPGDAPCDCGRRACYEQVASRAALQRAACDLGLPLDHAAAAARSGDPTAAALFQRYGRAVGYGLADLLTLFGPDRVVLGGGGARYLDLYYQGLSDYLDAISGCYHPTQIMAAEIGDLAGAVGAALWASQSIENDNFALSDRPPTPAADMPHPN